MGLGNDLGGDSMAAVDVSLDIELFESVELYAGYDMEMAVYSVVQLHGHCWGFPGQSSLSQ